MTLNVSKYYNFYMRSQYWSKEKLEEFQLQKIRELSQHFGLGIDNWRDFYAKPITSKQDIPINYTPKVRKYITHQTSGSTGEPRQIYVPASHWPRKEAVFMRCWTWLGWHGQPVVRLIAGKPTWPWYDGWRNVKILDYRRPGEEHFKYVIEKSPFLIHGRGGGVRGTCEGVIKMGRQDVLKDVGLLWLGETSEGHKERLKPFVRAFYEGYGLAELAPVASPCEYGSMHINMECGIIESINGEIVITDINNDAMPFIRYRTGDDGQIKESDCQCGRQHPILYNVRGRRTDFFDGPEVKRPIHWWIVSPISHDYFDLVKAWRAEVYPKKGMIIIHFVFREKEDFPRLEPYRRWIENETGLKCEFQRHDSATKWKRDLVRVFV
jgi:phenylacetate-CoA ligase